MNKIQRYQRTIKQLCLTYASQINSVYARNYCIEGESSKTNMQDQNNSDKELEASNFEQTFQSLDDIKIENNMAVPKRNTFASLLRHSKFIDIVNNDLYIDFGWKFYCVCPKPQKDSTQYIRGSKVKLLIKDLELSTRFLGASSDLTLLEADCVLLGLAQSPSEVQ
ncbi:28S ribosomal protein S28, mitochondrial [Melipona quadrifasciata]|uniref:28S ribosomal protein S28, mitochondrial n=1 Tax=Melipona quadrifasciata TaxID=166423 RepID=A0A0N0BBX4_9HYME|nr:28S ribosomal protein S28, mitochondrial [Melipona quadrifasciata]